MRKNKAGKLALCVFVTLAVAALGYFAWESAAPVGARDWAVGFSTPPRASATLPPPPEGLDEDGMVHLNTCDARALVTLPGIGEKTADAILAHRREHGPFETVEDIMDVKGIGPAKFEAIKDRITVE